MKGAAMLCLGRVLLGYCTGVLSYVVSISLLTLNMHPRRPCSLKRGWKVLDNVHEMLEKF